MLELPAKSKSNSETPSFVEDHDTLVKIYHEMVMIRRFEEKCAESYSLGKIGGFCHLYIGQEAVVAGEGEDLSGVRTSGHGQGDLHGPLHAAG